MLSFLFWNLNGNGPADRTAALKLRLGRMVACFDVDMFIFAESDFPPQELAEHLSGFNGGHYWHSRSESDRIHFFTRLDVARVHKQFDAGDRRLTIRRIVLPSSEILVAAVHLRSRLHQSEASASDLAGIVQSDIATVESDVDNYNTIVVGDLNLNPFSNGMISATKFHGVMTKDIAKGIERTVAGRQYRYFYNPMWGFFGDRSPGPPGTFYYSASAADEYHWHIVDQILLRPGLMNALTEVRILDTDGKSSLLNQIGRPDRRTASDHLPILFRLELNIQETIP